MTYPGSLDNGATDTEYTPTPERLLSAADARHEELRAMLADALVRIEQLEESIAWVYEQLRPELPTPSRGPRTLTADYLQGYADGRAAVVRTEGDYAHIPAAEWEDMTAELETLRIKDKMLSALTQAMTAELDALRAKWNAVPWDALLIVKWRVACYLPESLEARYNAFSTWLAANAPEEAAE